MTMNRWAPIALLLALPASSFAGEPVKFERIVIDDDFPGAYQVEVADVDGDGKPDVVAVGGGTCAWYQNPSWKKRLISTPKDTPDIISSATADLDGDGKAEVAIAYDFAMNEPKRGKLLLAIPGAKVDDPWTFRPISEAEPMPNVGGGGFAGSAGAGGGITGGGGAAVKADDRKLPRPLPVPSIHRLRWAWIVGRPRMTATTLTFDKKLELVVAPIFGPGARPPIFDQDPARLLLFDTGADPKSGRWSSRELGRTPVLHAIAIVKTGDGAGPSTVLAASNQGVTEFRPGAIVGDILFNGNPLAPGAPGNSPKKGASEVHLGKLKDGRTFLATVEPWHGTDVAVYFSKSLQPLKFGARDVIDASLKEGHALWVADVDGDGDDEVFAGFRGPGTSVLMFDYDGKTWTRSVVDPAIAAQDLRGGDIDGDGTPDVVAVGGSTHNVVWYKPVRPSK